MSVHCLRIRPIRPTRVTIISLSSATTGEGASYKSREAAAAAPSQPEPADTERAWDRVGFRLHGDCGQRRQRGWGGGDVLHPRTHALRP